MQKGGEKKSYERGTWQNRSDRHRVAKTDETQLITMLRARGSYIEKRNGRGGGALKMGKTKEEIG